MKGSCFLVFEEKTKKKKENWTEDRSARRTLTTITEGEERKTESKAQLERRGDAKKHEQGTFLGPLKLGATSVETNHFMFAAG